MSVKPRERTEAARTIPELGATQPLSGYLTHVLSLP